jgi:glycosyltransferase involved in cell wall biosynthesis
MIKIAHFGKYYFPDAGGIESVSLSIARGAVVNGYAVTVICFGNTQKISEEIVDQVRILRSPIALTIASQPLGLRYMYLCLRESRQANLVHLHAPNMLGCLCALFIARKTRLLVHWHSDVIGKGLLGKLLRPLEFLILKRADTIVATSKIYADASEILSKFREKVSVVPIGVPDVKPISDNVSLSTILSALVKIIAGRRIILAVGRLVPYKGFDVLIEAAKYINSDAVVIIVGDGQFRVDLQNSINSSGVAEGVHLTGRLSEECLRYLFSKASLYCMSSTNRAEAFGVVLLEAMAYGLPIVATDIPGSGVPWVNKHGTSGLNVPAGDPQALAEACNQILGSMKLCNKLACGARQRFMDEFTEDVFVKRMMDVYDSVYGQISDP